MKFTVLFIALLIGLVCFSQDESLGFSFNKKNTTLDTSKTLNFNSPKKGNVVVHADDRLKEITEFIGRESESVDGVKIDGYRIQIFFAESRTTAQSQKAGFLNTYTDHKAYIDYMAPNYRVRVGNFRTRIEAEALKKELVSVYPTCIVFKDKIELPVIKLEE